MDHNATALLTQFNALSPQSRQAVYYGILDQLRRAEWREVKHRADHITFECDVLAHLPLEIVALIAEHLNLADLVLLQRVSQRWRQVLSSPMVQNAAIRATLATDSNVSESERKAVIQKRLRLERGKPLANVSFQSHLNLSRNGTVNPQAAAYSNDIYAFLNGLHDYTSISLLNIRRGFINRLTTENREQLTALRISKHLIAAVSSRGYCHVWDMRTEEHKSFRLPSLRYTHFVLSGLRLAFSYRASIIHWAWESGITRTIDTQTCVVLLVPHPTSDQFSIVRVSEEVYYGDRMVIADQNCIMYVEEYVADNSSTGEFHCTHSQRQHFPLIDSGELYDLVDAQEVYQGQSSTLLVRKIPSGSRPGTDDYLTLFFSLEGGRIISHATPPGPRISSMACVGPNLIYAAVGERPCLLIMDSTYNKSVGECHHSVQRQDQYAPSWDILCVFGDSDFVVLISKECVEIRSFGETAMDGSESSDALIRRLTSF